MNFENILLLQLQIFIKTVLYFRGCILPSTNAMVNNGPRNHQFQSARGPLSKITLTITLPFLSCFSKNLNCPITFGKNVTKNFPLQYWRFFPLFNSLTLLLFCHDPHIMFLSMQLTLNCSNRNYSGYWFIKSQSNAHIALRESPKIWRIIWELFPIYKRMKHLKKGREMGTTLKEKI